MSRSIKIGHCVCDPRKPCPCPIFKEKNICTCAGERVPPEDKNQPVKLTEFVRSAGCASKISQKDLHQVLNLLPTISDPRLLVGTSTADDAGVFQITPELTVVQTVDVFTPGVDDPFLFGRIAACNSLSDVYAMGGKPVTALSVIGFPIYSLPHEVMADIIKGGIEVLNEADTILLGGHSINDEEIKFGFAVTGIVNNARFVTNAHARPGDSLILTKPLGTGILSLANQIDRASAKAVTAVTKSMSTLNRAAAEIMLKYEAHACTDVTGFGILGHLSQMMIESKTTAEIWFNELPLLPEALDLAKQGIYSGANERNAEYSAKRTTMAEDVTEEMKALLFDAQTSGGLLISLPPEKTEQALVEMHEAGVSEASIIGRIADSSDGHIKVMVEAPDSARTFRASRTQNTASDKENEMTTDTAGEETCCAQGSGTPDKAMQMFTGFMGTAMQPGAVDVVTKELMAVALGLAVHCVPCAKIHIKKSLDMGISKEELEEAAALAVAFSGCRALMVWNELKEELF